MEQIAESVWILPLWPGHRINAYVLGDVLVDTGTRWDARRIQSQLRGRTIAEIALTHAHPDHQGSAHVLCERFRVPLACPFLDVPAAEGRVPLPPNHPLGNLVVPFFGGPPHRVSRQLREGDRVADFEVMEAPGHTPGQCMLFRTSDRVLIAGDILANLNFLTGKTGLREPPHIFSTDWRQNRQSIQKIRKLRPSVICFGHGPVLYGPAMLDRFAL